jgi:hypothetical protein
LYRCGEGEQRETLAELLEKLEKDAAAAGSVKSDGGSGGGGVVVPVPGAPVTSATVYLTDGGEDAAAALGAVRVTFAPAAAMSKVGGCQRCNAVETHSPKAPGFRFQPLSL